MSIQVSTRIDETTKRQFDEICERIGITPSNALSIFIKGVINNNGIPFAVMAPPAENSIPPMADKPVQTATEKTPDIKSKKENTETANPPEKPSEKTEEKTITKQKDKTITKAEPRPETETEPKPESRNEPNETLQELYETAMPKKRKQDNKNTLEHYENFFKKWEAGRKTKTDDTPD